MYIGCGRLSIIITEGQMRIFLMTPVGVVVTTRGRERVKVKWFKGLKEELGQDFVLSF